MSDNDQRRLKDDQKTIDRIPGTKHKVIGLVSGGKDSTCNLLHCVANGHQVVALATLTPEPGVDELDSHLYQSVGTTLLPLLAQSMQLPLFTRVIKGKAVARGAEYGSRLKSGEGSEVGGDETEDLYRLLKAVKQSHPETTALASGAILSSYQRIRIEHVCARLGLVSLSYLWQAEQLPLLDRMLSCGMEVVLMKVAGVGLGVELVGKSLREVRPLLGRLERQYGSHPAGEGGEYETLTLSTPLFSHRLNILKSEVIITDPEPYPVAYLKILEAELVKKENWMRPTVKELREMLGLDEGEEGEEGLDEDSKEIMEELKEWDSSRSNNGTGIRLDKSGLNRSYKVEDGIDYEGTGEHVKFAKRGRWFAASVSSLTVGGDNVGDELKKCFDGISSTLSKYSLSLPLHTAHITLLIPSMSLFVPANAVYATYFGSSPPSRATVAVPLKGGRMKLEVVGFDDRPNNSGHPTESTNTITPNMSADLNNDLPEVHVGNRQALHVQGLSYWAPANIGPYSQAVIVNSRVQIAGQIPLIPSSLTIPRNPSNGTSPYIHQATLALQHVRKVLDLLRNKQSTGGGWDGWCESVVGWWVDDGSGGVGLGIVRKTWEIWAERNACLKAPVVLVQASELPRGALVEFQVNWHTSRRGNSSITQALANAAIESDDEDVGLEARYSWSTKGSNTTTRFESCSTSSEGQGGRMIIFIGDPSDLSSANLPDLNSAVGAKVYHLHSLPRSYVERVINQLWTVSDTRPCITSIPVLSISDRDGTSASIALEIFVA